MATLALMSWIFVKEPKERHHFLARLAFEELLDRVIALIEFFEAFVAEVRIVVVNEFINSLPCLTVI